MSEVLIRLYGIIEERRGADPDKSYVARLFARGQDTILKKVGEEATEAVLAAKGGHADQLVAECADLWFHSLVMLAQAGVRPEAVLAELSRREGLSGLDEFAARKSIALDSEPKRQA